MTTPTQVDTQLEEISVVMNEARRKAKGCVRQMRQARNQVNDITTEFADLITTVNAYAGADAFETQAKSKLARYTAEFTALELTLRTARNQLNAIDFDN